eukprot:6212992-Pleurochrysis_carterae.AAC.2
MAARMSPLLLLAMLLGASATVLAGGLSGSTLGDRCARLESHGAIRGHNAGQCSVASRLSRSAVLMVRGGADELDDELDVDEEGETGADDLEGAESLENPFLGGSSAGGMGGERCNVSHTMSLTQLLLHLTALPTQMVARSPKQGSVSPPSFCFAGGAGLQDLAQSLQDPQMLQARRSAVHIHRMTRSSIVIVGGLTFSRHPYDMVASAHSAWACVLPWPACYVGVRVAWASVSARAALARVLR